MKSTPDLKNLVLRDKLFQDLQVLSGWVLDLTAKTMIQDHKEGGEFGVGTLIF